MKITKHKRISKNRNKKTKKGGAWQPNPFAQPGPQFGPGGPPFGQQGMSKKAQKKFAKQQQQGQQQQQQQKGQKDKQQQKAKPLNNIERIFADNNGKKRGTTKGKTLKNKMLLINQRLQRCARYLVVDHKSYNNILRDKLDNCADNLKKIKTALKKDYKKASKMSK